MNIPSKPPAQSSIASTVRIETSVLRETAFVHIVPIDLTTIFTSYGRLPAVCQTSHQTGNWDSIGQTRCVTFSDGSTAQERLTGYIFASYFSYTVNGFTDALRFLARSAEGEWWFSQTSENTTLITWQYRFYAKFMITMPLVWMINKLLWRGYMNKAITLCNAQLTSIQMNQLSNKTAQ